MITICLFGSIITVIINIDKKSSAQASFNDIEVTHMDQAVSRIENSLKVVEGPALAQASYLEPLPDATNHHVYFEILDSCFPEIDDECAYSYSEPSSTSTKRKALRQGVVLFVKRSITGHDGELWHEIDFPEWLRYPGRLQLPWYVQDNIGKRFTNIGVLKLNSDTPETNKRIIIERSSQMLYAYEGEELFLATSTATGILNTPTPRGHFTAFMKTPSRYMQGPIPGITSKYYDLPGVPWNIYFTHQGAIIHGVYWHNNFGSPYSNGCVNLPTNIAREIYEWADLGMSIIVRD